MFNQQSGAQTQFVEMVNTMNNDLLIRTEGGFYLTDPYGNSYTYLHGLSQNVPQNIRKWIVRDSNTVVVLAEQDTRQLELFIYSKESSWQPQTSNVHRYNIFRILKLADGRLCGSFDESTINKVSSDEGLTWSNFTFDSSAVIRVINIDTSSDILLTQKAKLYISFDKNKNWLDITPVTEAANPEVFYFQNGRIAFLVKWPSGKRDVYLSSDFGKTWKKRLNDIGFYPSLYYAIDKVNNWILTIYPSNYGTVYKSADDGYSWAIDDRFKEFHRVSDLKIQADGTMLAAAKRDSDGLAGIFISRNNQSFQLLSQDLSKSNFQIFDKYYPDILALSLERGILRVDVNTGAITAKYNEGLPIVLPGSDFIWINGMIWDKDDQLYISVGFDNMYKNEIGFVTAVESTSKGSNLGQLQFYNNRLYLETKDEINISSSVVLEISDVVGRTIFKSKLGKDQLLSGYEIPFQAQGIYCIQVIDKVKQQIWRSKISVVR
ncbi:MAG TPA: hypothetical protein PK006_07575 [Saprospiraceae bacterium]|nr:hypothetical protein [Saprospiraceae bacterium]